MVMKASSLTQAVPSSIAAAVIIVAEKINLLPVKMSIRLYLGALSIELLLTRFF
jgi:hypothetical protein